MKSKEQHWGEEYFLLKLITFDSESPGRKRKRETERERVGWTREEDPGQGEREETSWVW